MSGAPEAAAGLSNPAGWPEEILPLLQRAITCEFATVTRQGTPITLPLTPYVGEDGRTLDVSTGLTYPAKAERVRRNPRVSMLFSDAVGSGLSDPPTVLVYGLAAVRDHDLQANTDRYLRLSFAKLPGLYQQVPWLLLRQQRWYWSRIWIVTVPLRILWWPAGHLDEAPQRWEAPPETLPLASDRAPSGHQPPPWRRSSDAWQPRASYALRRLGAPILTVMDPDGFPVSMRVLRASQAESGFRLTLVGAPPTEVAGPACLTFHEHDERFRREENATFVGRAAAAGDGEGVVLEVERVLGDLSAPGSWPRRVWSMLAAGWRLNPRLRSEVERRGQPVPRVRHPRAD